MGNTSWYSILNRAYGVDWELGSGFQWLNLERWYGLSLDEVQEVITRYEGNQSLLSLSEQQVRYVVDRYGLRQVAERVEAELGGKNRVRVVSLTGRSINNREEM